MIYILLSICILSLGISIYCVISLLKVKKEYQSFKQNINDTLSDELSNINEIKLNVNNTLKTTSKQYNELIFKYNKFNTTLETFNNGFTPRESFM